MKDKWSKISILITSIGVLLIAFFIPTYTGAAHFSSKKSIPVFQKRAAIGKVGNGLLVIGTLGQLIGLFIKKEEKI